MIRTPISNEIKAATQFPKLYSGLWGLKGENAIKMLRAPALFVP